MKIALSFPNGLPQRREFAPGIRRAPDRGRTLSESELVLALANALRYIPEEYHDELAPEFLEEYQTTGRIYGYRFRPEGRIKGLPVEQYPGKCLEAKAFNVMIDNNLDFEVALYPYELVTYGETGQVFQNWMQYLLVKEYLKHLDTNFTLVIESGHPLGLFRAPKGAPRVVITNGLMVGQFDDPRNFARAAALGVANYGQMTAGGWMYIGPQGIVHGTYNTILNAARMTRKDTEQAARGMLFVSSGLGGMSGAQPKAAEIAGAVSIVAEVDDSRIETRMKQGWVRSVADSPESAFLAARDAQENNIPLSIAYRGNVVDLLEYAVESGEHIDLLSDQTSCHAVYEGGYCPQSCDFPERTRLLRDDPSEFRRRVDISLARHFQAIEALTARGTYFFDYGNSFLASVFQAGIKQVARNGHDTYDGFIYPSYVEDIMGPLLFDFGYGPFRWVCLSGEAADLEKTDKAAMSCINADERFQDRDNWAWIRDAAKNNLVVGTYARILYQDERGRIAIALKFNDMVRKGDIGPVMIGRDHHDVSGTDSPFRETANIRDGSNVMAEMAIQCFAGNAARGMSMIALHNGGGVGVGRAINGGFGLVLDGSDRVDEIIANAVSWDVMGGVARRAWARNRNALRTAAMFNDNRPDGHITLPHIADMEKLGELVAKGEPA